MDEPAESLHKWAVKEMNFRPEGKYVNSKVPSVEDFKSLCRGDLLEVWKYVSQNVKPGQWALKNEGYKVSYKSPRVYDDEKTKERLEKLTETKTLQSQRESLKAVREDLGQVQQTVMQSEKEIQQLWEEINELRRKSAILTAYSSKVKNNINKLEEFSKRINGQTEKIRGLTLKSTEAPKMFTRKGSSGEDEENVLLESACTKEVRENCESIHQFLGQLLSGHFADNKSLMERERNKLLAAIDRLVTSFPPGDILASIQTHTQEATYELRDRARNINITNDAEKLKFKFETDGRLTDLSSPPDPIQNVQQLVEKSHADESERTMETERHRNNSWQHTCDLDTTSRDIISRLTKQYMDNPGNLELAKALYQTELRVAAAKGSLEALQGCSDRFREKIVTANHEKEILHQKSMKIHDFKQVVDSKQNLIQVLVKQNLQSQPNIEKQKSEISQYIQQCVTSSEAEVAALAGQLKDTSLIQSNEFSQLGLNQLMFSVLESAHKVAVIDLSINRLKINPSTRQGQKLSEVLNVLEFATYKAPEQLLPRLREINNEMQEIEVTMRRQEILTEHFLASDYRGLKTEEQISEVCKKVGEQDKRQLEELVSLLQKRISNATRALGDIISIKNTTEAWWEQPGQNCAPWLKVDGASLAEWKDRWTIEATRLRQQTQHQ